MLNESGTYENDCLVLRRNEKSLMMICPTQQQTRILDWLQNHLQGFKSVSLQDITSLYTVLTLVGPKAKDLMAEMCETEIDLAPLTFRFFNMSYASGVMAMAITQTGEPGYSLYVPTESALHLYDKLMRVGANYGIRNVGLLAMRFLRIERFIPFWGDELNSDSNPFETGRGGKVMFNKGDFIGRDAIMKIKDQGVFKRLAQFHLLNFDIDKDLWPGGGEALYRNGEYVGYVTNTAYGFTLGKMVCLGFVQHPDTFKGGEPKVLENSWLLDRKASWAINIAGQMIPLGMCIFFKTFKFHFIQFFPFTAIHLHPPKIPQFNIDVNKDYKPKKPKSGHAPNVNIVQKVKPKEKFKIPFHPNANI